MTFPQKFTGAQLNSYFFLKLDEFRLEIQRRDQEIMAMAAKMKTLEEQHQVSFDDLLTNPTNHTITNKKKIRVFRTISATSPY